MFAKIKSSRADQVADIFYKEQIDGLTAGFIL
jgi:hypothetical protein